MIGKIDRFLDNIIDRAMAFVDMRKWEKEKRKEGFPSEWFEDNK